ncbi:MAG: site-2 protease family protein [Bacillota bacterium]|jgi:Zn-dependent protease
MPRLGPELFLQIPALVIALSFHEYAHAWVSDRMGDPTPRVQGRLTLNPLVHVDPIGMLMLLFFRFGWAKPVQVNPYNYESRERGIALVSLAGPAMNLLLGLVSVMLIFVSALWVGFQPLTLFAELLAIYNIGLAVFNLLPIPPLDGSKLLFLFLPRSVVYRYLDAVGQWGTLILILLVSTGMVSAIIGPVASSIFDLYSSIARAIFL